jgi:erythromycin esterase-like protein
MLRFVIPILLLTLFACSEQSSPEKSDSKETVDHHRPIKLPDDISQIKENDLEELIPMLGNARIIGVSEGTHGMIEPFYCRNAIFKLLVKEKRIGAIAFESGLVEGKLMYDYVNGENISLDSVIEHGISCNFGEFELNHELLEWLRAYNLDLPEKEKIHLYGYDIPGCAPNSELENAKLGFEHMFKYLDKVDPISSSNYQNQLSQFLPLLHIKDNAKDERLHFWDIDSTGWSQLIDIISEAQQQFSNNKEAYISKSNLDDFQWANRSVLCASQNVRLLHSIGNPDYNYSPREKGHLENVEWILNREEGRSIALFSHIAHLAKEIHMNTEGGMAVPMAGEYLKEAFKDDYVVIGNFYRKLDWFDDDPIILEDSLMANQFQENKLKNFFMKLDKSDTIWQREWPFGKPSSRGQVYMNPSESIDIILYNDVQTWLYHYQEEKVNH